MTNANRIQWLNQLIGLEIVLWELIDDRLKEKHDLSHAFFQSLYFIGCSPDGSLRIGDLARSLRITVGATSKLVDRIEAAGLVTRKNDVDDRRASRLVLTRSGARKLADASKTYEATMAKVLDAALSADEQQQLHDLIRRLLATTSEEESPGLIQPEKSGRSVK